MAGKESKTGIIKRKDVEEAAVVFGLESFALCSKFFIAINGPHVVGM